MFANTPNIPETLRSTHVPTLVRTQNYNQKNMMHMRMKDKKV